MPVGDLGIEGGSNSDLPDVVNVQGSGLCDHLGRTHVLSRLLLRSMTIGGAHGRNNCVSRFAGEGGHRHTGGPMCSIRCRMHKFRLTQLLQDDLSDVAHTKH